MTGYDEWLVGNAGRDPYEDDAIDEMDDMGVADTTDADDLADLEPSIRAQMIATGQTAAEVYVERFDSWFARLKAAAKKGGN